MDGALDIATKLVESSQELATARETAVSTKDTAYKAALQAVVDFKPDFGSVPLSLTEAVEAA